MADSPRVCSFESRRAEQMAQLIERNGGQPLVAPSMQEVPLQDNREGLESIRRLVLGDMDCLILLTGVGTTAMLDLARTASLEQQLLERLASLPVIARGPKPIAVLHRLGIEPAARADSPNTWREVMQAFDDAGIGLKGRIVAVQEYGIPSSDLVAALEKRGAAVRPIPVYRWALPDDVTPLQNAIRATVAGDTDLTLFTSAQQIRHVLQVAAEMDLKEAWCTAVPRVASIGPTCSEALRDEQIDVWFESDPPKMGALVRGALEKYRG